MRLWMFNVRRPLYTRSDHHPGSEEFGMGVCRLLRMIASFEILSCSLCQFSYDGFYSDNHLSVPRCRFRLFQAQVSRAGVCADPMLNHNPCVGILHPSVRIIQIHPVQKYIKQMPPSISFVHICLIGIGIPRSVTHPSGPSRIGKLFPIIGFWILAAVERARFSLSFNGLPQCFCGCVLIATLIFHSADMCIVVRTQRRGGRVCPKRRCH